VPHIASRSHQSRATAARTIGEPYERVLVHAQPFLDITLRERARRHLHSLCASAQTLDRGFRETKAHRLTHVAQRIT